jgi:hypothetical protein
MGWSNWRKGRSPASLESWPGDGTAKRYWRLLKKSSAST